MPEPFEFVSPNTFGGDEVSWTRNGLSGTVMDKA